MIAKGFIPEMGTKPFAIMEGHRECEISEVSGGGRDYVCAAGAEAITMAAAR